MHQDPSDAPKGIPTLGNLLARRNTVVDLVEDDCAAANDVQSRQPETEEGQGGVSDTPEVSAEGTVAKRRRSTLDRNSTHMAYFKFQKSKIVETGRVVEQFHCIACDAGKDPNWMLYKQDSILKHIGKQFNSDGELVERSDRNKGTSHAVKVKQYEERVRRASDPGVQRRILYGY